jgi:hypothetical protein
VNSEEGAQSAALLLITSPVTVSSLTYDDTPAGRLSVTWQAVNQSSVSGYQVILSDPKHQWVQTSTATQATFEQSLHVSRTYCISVRATGSAGTVFGPASAVMAPILSRVRLKSVSYATLPTPALTLTWDSPSAAGRAIR